MTVGQLIENLKSLTADEAEIYFYETEDGKIVLGCFKQFKSEDNSSRLCFMGIVNTTTTTEVEILE